MVHAQQRTVAEEFLFEQVNASRATAGLPALTWNALLTRAAVSHADRMPKEDTLSHQFDREPDLPERATADGIRFTVIAENIGLGNSAAEMHQSFMDSPDHRGNILDPKVNSIGISVQEAYGELWVVEVFAGMTAELTYEEQEHRVAAMLKATGLRKVEPTGTARETCRMTLGFAGAQPAYVLRLVAADVTALPVSLVSRLAQGDIREAAVGACPRTEGNVSSFSIAVVLYR